MPIRFYGTRGTYGCFSNFSRHGIHLDGAFWPTTEHYFQAQKFHGTEYEDAVRRAATPKFAARMGRDRALPLRPDWEAIKDDVMRRAVRQKFTEHADLRAVLLATGDEAIVEDSPRDAYWGCGKDGTGKNMLGTILMEIRVELRTSDPLAG
jgi:ribA/ribD-fused uncharacterized protein